MPPAAIDYDQPFAGAISLSMAGTASGTPEACTAAAVQAATAAATQTAAAAAARQNRRRPYNAEPHLEDAPSAPRDSKPTAPPRPSAFSRLDRLFKTADTSGQAQLNKSAVSLSLTQLLQLTAGPAFPKWRDATTALLGGTEVVANLAQVPPQPMAPREAHVSWADEKDREEAQEATRGLSASISSTAASLGSGLSGLAPSTCATFSAAATVNSLPASEKLMSSTTSMPFVRGSIAANAMHPRDISIDTGAEISAISAGAGAAHAHDPV